ncbi:hypothetical protein ACTRXD_17925 [Nitrospira sp. T9]
MKFDDAEYDGHVVFLTNKFDLPALSIGPLDPWRWQTELFFK